MDVAELFGLAQWVNKHVQPSVKPYQALQNVLQNNATQPSKQPVKEPLDALVRQLDSTPVQKLSANQASVLTYLNIDGLIGARGVRFVRGLIETSDFDPATAASEMQDAVKRLRDGIGKIEQIGSALTDLPLLQGLKYDSDEGVYVQVQFQKDASISNVDEWKRWGNDWHAIVRGIALCVHEAPANTRVVGAATGSVMLVLLATLAFSSVLALIVRRISSIILEGIQVTSAIEDLRHKKILNRAVEESLLARKKEIEDTGLDVTIKEVKSTLPRLNGEQETALKRSIEKLFKFNDLGGDVDFIAPTPSAGSSAVEQDSLRQALENIKSSIEEIRSNRIQVKLLDGADTEVESAD